MTTHTDTDFEFDTSNGIISGATAVFEYATDFVRRDPECGYFDDRTEVIHCELVTLQIGGLPLDRYTVEHMDKAALLRAEEVATDEIQQQLDTDELAPEPRLYRRELNLEAAE